VHPVLGILFLGAIARYKTQSILFCMGCPQPLPIWQEFWAIIKLKQALQGLKREDNIYARLRLKRRAGKVYAWNVRLEKLTQSLRKAYSCLRMKRGAGKVYAVYAGQEKFTQETQNLRKKYAGLRGLCFLNKILRKKTQFYAWNSGLRRGQFADGRPRRFFACK
jgi:hypothetical protein